MRLLCSLLACALAVVMLAACNSSEMKGNRAGSSAGSNGNSAATSPGSPSAHVAPSDGVKRVTTTEVRDALDKGTAIVIDVRPAASYQQNHIKGSISIPLEQMEAHLNELPRDKMIVTYCS